MSASNDLQKLIFEMLTNDEAITALIDGRVFDCVSGEQEFPNITFGSSDQVADDAECISGVTETLQLDCWSRSQSGFKELKNITHAVKKCLHRSEAQLETHALVEMRVTAIRHFRDPDGQTSHGVVTIKSMIEEK